MILIVEDYPELCHILQWVVQDAGKKSVCTNDGAAALDIMLEHQPSLVILDDMIPGLTGLELLRVMHDNEQLSKIPVLMYSAAESPERRAEAEQLGAIGWLTKGGNLAELKSVIVRHGN